VRWRKECRTARAGVACGLTHLKPGNGSRREDDSAMKTQLRVPPSTGQLDDWRVADAQALRAERQVVQKMKAAASSGAAAPSEDERRRAVALRAQANALLGKAIA